MRNFLFILGKYGGFLSFLILECVCIFLIVNNNRGQKAIFINSSNIISGKLLDRYTQVNQYFELEAIADSLQKENAYLRSQLEYSKFWNTVEKDTILTDSLTIQYTYIPARVINNSFNRHNNFLTIDRGKNQGLDKDMAVIGQSGIVGIVKNNSENMAQVMSVLHRQTRISARIKSSDYFGTLMWKGNDHRKMQLEAIPKHIDLTLGDSIITSGFSSMFPEGILIGRISDFHLPEGSNFYHIDVTLQVDLASVRRVYVVNNLMREEQIKMEDSENAQ